MSHPQDKADRRRHCIIHAKAKLGKARTVLGTTIRSIKAKMEAEPSNKYLAELHTDLTSLLGDISNGKLRQVKPLARKAGKVCHKVRQVATSVTLKV